MDRRDYRVQVLDNGYLFTITEPVPGKGDVATERSVWQTKEALLGRLEVILPAPIGKPQQ